MAMSNQITDSRLRALIAKWRHEAAEEQRVSFCADELEAILAEGVPFREENRVRALIDQLPKHLLWHLVDRFERHDRGVDADDEYVKLSDLKAVLAEGVTPDSPSLADAAEMLWVVLANVSGGDWTKQSPEWQEAATRWRDNYFSVTGVPLRPATVPPKPTLRPNRFDCPECGPGIGVDEDLCCRTCGSDATVVVAGVTQPRMDDEPESATVPPEPSQEPIACEACEAGFRLASDGIHYDDARGGWTWGVCRKVVARLRDTARQTPESR